MRSLSFFSIVWILLTVLSPLFGTPDVAGAPLSALVNPLVKQRADPHVMLHSDGFYYMTATVPEYDRIELRRSSSIEGLATAEVSTIWVHHETGVMANHIWAPEIHFINGKWYVYFTAGRSDNKWAIRLYVLESSSENPLAGTWIERGQLKTNWESFSLDATTFEHRGRRYLVWTQVDDNFKGTNLYIAEMDTPLSIKGVQIMLTKPEFPWEQAKYKVNEAPAVLIRNGRVWLSYSASVTDDRYCLGLLHADENSDLLKVSSWSKSPNPVFVSSIANGQFGPGHNSFTTTPDRKTDILVYHARNYKTITGDPLNDPNRNTRVQILNWNSDGTPNFGEPVSDGPYRP